MNRLTLRRNGANLELRDSRTGSVLRSGPLASLRAIDIQGADGETRDTLTVDFTGGMFQVLDGIRHDGGVGGYDTLVVAGGAAMSERYEMKNAHDGTITLDGLHIAFSNLEPISDTVPSANFTFNATAAGETINIVDGPLVGGVQTTQINGGGSPTFELVNFANKTNVTVNGLGGDDTFTLDVTTPAAGLSHLVVDGGGDPNDTASLASFNLPGGTLSVSGMKTISQTGGVQVSNLAVQASGGVALLTLPIR